MLTPQDIENPVIPDFEEYIRQGEPGKKERAQIWRTAIGLQAVDGLQVSDYLKQTVKRNIEGEISIDEVQRLVKAYYVSKTNREPDDDDKREADSVAGNIGKILASDTLDFSTNGFIALHRRIFKGVFKNAGQVRDYDITKKEFVLRGDTVRYLNWEDLRRALDYEIAQEKDFSYKGLPKDEIVSHIAQFTSGIWQIHAFGEGNTRTTAVFIILYLRSIGFPVSNDMFAENSWYFRNALVRANYKNAVYGIEYTLIYLERFFRNLLLGEQWELKSRYLVINPPAEYAEQPRKATPQDNLLNDSIIAAFTPQVTPQVIRVYRAVGNSELSKEQIMKILGLSDPKNFRLNYLQPALAAGLLEMTIPDKPTSKNQKYRISSKGKKFNL